MGEDKFLSPWLRLGGGAGNRCGCLEESHLKYIYFEPEQEVLHEESQAVCKTAQLQMDNSGFGSKLGK